MTEEVIKVKEVRKMDVLNVKQVRAYIQAQDLMCAKELPEAFSPKVKDLLKEACVRCVANGRRTVQAKDL